MRPARRFVISVSIFILLSGMLASYAQDSNATTDPVMRAMTDEINRSMTQLQFKDLDKPYFIQYITLDEEEYNASATYGALTSSRQGRQRVLFAQVRVGDYEFDNSEFVTGNGVPPSGIIEQTIIDNDYGTMRRAFWLATDAAYKQSVEVLARKRAYVENKIRNEEIPDFSQEAATRAIAPSRTLTFDKTLMEKQLREWSRIFRDFPDIQTSDVRLMARLTHRYLVNSEGTHTMQPAVLVSLEARGSVQASDGMRITHSVPFYTRSLDQLPPPHEIAAAIRKLATDLTAVRNAPTLDADYSGPVMLTGAASADLFARVLAPNLSGQRGPLTDRPQQSSTGSELLNRMNRPVLPAYFSVFDDPGQLRFGNQGLIGYYRVDDQGVPAKRVSLVEDGLLTNLLMGRRPDKDRPQSNGHGRSGFPGRETAQISNLFINVSDGKSYEELKQELIKSCRTERLQYGILIKAIAPGGGGGIGSPVLVYKVYVADGREELIRGVNAAGLSVASLRHIQAAGSDEIAVNRLTGFRGAETPVSVVAPSVLLEEMELKRSTGAQQKPALLTPPQTAKP